MTSLDRNLTLQRSDMASRTYYFWNGPTLSIIHDSNLSAQIHIIIVYQKFV